MGKRQIGELQPSELAVTLLIADLASIPMQATDIPLLTGLIPIATLLAVSYTHLDVYKRQTYHVFNFP